MFNIVVDSFSYLKATWVCLEVTVGQNALQEIYVIEKLLQHVTYPHRFNTPFYIASYITHILKHAVCADHEI